MRRRGRRVLASLVGAAVLAAALTGPAAAHDDEESEAEVGALEVEARPGLVVPGQRVVVEAEWDLEDEDDDETDSTGLGGAAVTVDATVDWGDGGAAQAMVARPDDDDIELRATHTYAADGQYTVTVTATPSTGEPITATVVVQVGAGVARLSGDDRFDTANDISHESHPEGGAAAVILTRGDGFADALSSAAFALSEDAPVLLTPTDTLPPAVLAEIERLLAPGGTVYVLGGPTAVSPAVEEAVRAAGFATQRVAGEDRVETAVLLAQLVQATGAVIDEVVVASAVNFPDALALASYAAQESAPVLLTWPDQLPAEVAAFLASLPAPPEVKVAGGPEAVSDAVLAQLQPHAREVERLAGPNRFATSARVAEALFPAPATVVLTTGLKFPDALAGGAHAGRLQAPVLLVEATLPADVLAYLQAHAATIERIYVLGGPTTVAPEVVAQAEAAIR